MQLIFIYSLMWIVFFLILLWKGRKYKTLIYIVCIWTFSSIASIVYVSFQTTYDKIEPIPYLFLAFCLACAFLPYAVPNDKIEFVTIGNDRLYKQLIIILGVISILPFCENLLHVLSSYGGANNESLADIYDDKMSGDFNRAKFVNWFSFPGKIFNSINLKFQYVSLFLLFLYMSRDKFSKNMFFLLFITVCNPILYSFGLSGRTSLVFTILRAGLLYCMFSHIINKKVKKLFLRYSLIFVVCGVVLITILTIARYSANEGANSIPLYAWISLYIGEGSVNFNNYMWNIRCFTEGDNCFAFLKDFVGLDTFTDYLDRRVYWGPKTGINPARFYTFVGDIFSDIGYFTLPVILFVGYILRLKVIRKPVLSVMVMYVYYTWAYLCISGITCYTFKSYTSSVDLFTSFVIIYFISYRTKSKYYLTTKQ